MPAVRKNPNGLQDAQNFKVGNVKCFVQDLGDGGWSYGWTVGRECIVKGVASSRMEAADKCEEKLNWGEA